MSNIAMGYEFKLSLWCVLVMGCELKLNVMCNILAVQYELKYYCYILVVLVMSVYESIWLSITLQRWPIHWQR